MAATQLFDPAYTGVMQVPGYANLRDKAMDKYLKNSANVPLVNGQFFSEEDVDTLAPKFCTWSNELKTPGISNDTDRLPMEQPASGYSKELDVQTYRLAVRLERTMEKTDRSGKVREMTMSGLPDSGRRFMELKMADIFNSGASTEGADGSNLFATDHYHEDASAGQYSNEETGAALTSTTFETMRQNMRKRTSTKGYISPITLEKVVVPVALQQKAEVIQGSNKKPENSLNEINTLQGKFDIVVNDYLTSDTAWFGWGNLPEAMWGMHVAWLTRFNVMSLEYPNADYPDIVAGWRLYGQVDVKASVPKNIHYNAGA